MIAWITEHPWMTLIIVLSAIEAISTIGVAAFNRFKEKT